VRRAERGERRGRGDELDRGRRNGRRVGIATAEHLPRRDVDHVRGDVRAERRIGEQRRQRGGNLLGRGQRRGRSRRGREDREILGGNAGIPGGGRPVDEWRGQIVGPPDGRPGNGKAHDEREHGGNRSRPRPLPL
jgi:hypothetical protein